MRSDRKFVVTRPFPSSGLGANLLSMVGALYVCERTNRSLIVDWTGMDELRDKRTNYFVAFFEPIRRSGNVDISYVGDAQPASDYPLYDRRGAFEPDEGQWADVVAGRVDADVIVLEPFHYSRVFHHTSLTESERSDYTRAFYRLLKPRPVVRRRMTEMAAQFDRRVVVGLHVRSGNGEFAAGGPYANRVNTSVFERDTFVDRLHRACRDCVAGLSDRRAGFGVFVATDSADMQQRLLRIPGAFSARRRFPPAGAGHQFADYTSDEYGSYTDVDAAVDTIVDMFMLAECRGLVCNESAFNMYAKGMTNDFNGNVRLLESYFDSPVKRFARAARALIGERGSRR